MDILTWLKSSGLIKHKLVNLWRLRNSLVLELNVRVEWSQIPSGLFCLQVASLCSFGAILRTWIAHIFLGWLWTVVRIYNWSVSRFVVMLLIWWFLLKLGNINFIRPQFVKVWEEFLVVSIVLKWTLQSSFKSFLIKLVLLNNTIMASEPCPLTGAERAVCRLVHCGPRPQAMLKPLPLELQVYVDKTRTKQKHRYCKKKTKQNSKVTRQVFTNQNDLGEHIHSILGQCYEIWLEDSVILAALNDCSRQSKSFLPQKWRCIRVFDLTINKL